MKKMNELPRIILTVEHMRHEILHAFNGYTDGLKEQVEQSLDSAIKHFDFDAEISKIATGVLREVILSSIRSAIGTLKWDEKLRDQLVKSILASLECNPR